MKKSFTPLIEKASNSDAFKHQTHEKIATAISNLLKNNKGSGQTIGLEGSWGVGKSTVIALLRDKLPDNDFIYFYFDAWAHEGDPLRRVFLESFLDNLKIKNDSLDNLRNKISKRTKFVRTQTKRNATLFGYLFSFSLLFVPLGAAIVSAIDFSKITFSNGHPASWKLILGVFFTIVPILVLFGNFLKLLLSNKQSVKDKENWSILEDNSNSEVFQEISEDEERSSIEFERYFTEIIEVIINSQKKKQVVIVVDNLDRVDAKDSLKIWSTLQTFLQPRNPYDKVTQLFKNIWVISTL